MQLISLMLQNRHILGQVHRLKEPRARSMYASKPKALQIDWERVSHETQHETPGPTLHPASPSQDGQTVQLARPK